MTSSDELENKSLEWWLKQLSPRQIWGILVTIVVLLGAAFSTGFWISSHLDNEPNNDSFQSDSLNPQLESEIEYPEGLNSFDVSVLKVLSEPQRHAVTLEYLAYRLQSNPRRVETTLEKLSKKRLIFLIMTEYGDVDSATINQNGLDLMNEHNLFD